MNKLYEKALRNKYRFQTDKGYVNVEQLWDLNLEQLDVIAQQVAEVLEKSSTKSFIKKKTTASEELSNKLEILKHLIATKLAEANEAEEREVRRQQAARIEEIIRQKKDDDLAGKSIQELTAMLDELK